MGSLIAYEYTTQTHLLVTDEDAAEFLQSQFTNELRPIEEGRCTYGLWLDVKGKVLADSYVLCEGDERFRMISETSAAAVLKANLEHHIIADDVIIETEAAITGFALIGDDLESTLNALGLNMPDSDSFTSAHECLAYQGRRSRQANFEVLCLSTDAVEHVRTGLAAHGVQMVDLEVVELQRVAAGYPLVPVEVGPNDLPGEGGMEQDAISFTKGCYLGQEVVARMYNVGRPQRNLFVVSGSGEVPKCPLVLYNSHSKAVGEVRTSIETDTGWRGVAMLKHRFAKVGDHLIAGNIQVSVVQSLRS